MNLVIGFDLSTACSGFAIFSEDGNLFKYGQIKPKTTLSTLEKIVYISSEIYLLINNLKEHTIKKVIIENIFLNTYFGGKSQVIGFANLGRLSGAVIMTLCFALNKKPDEFIELKMAVEARPLIGLKGNCKKAEVQAWVLKNIFGKDTNEYDALIDAVYCKKQTGEISNEVFKKRMDEISKLIEEETKIGEDIADACILGKGGIK